jgi:cytidylate kinase
MEISAHAGAVVVTIDGPAGAGKSTVAKTLAQRLGFDYLDTGAMYRAVALLARRLNLLEDAERLSMHLDTAALEISGGLVRLNGEDVTGLLRDPEVTRGSSLVAAIPAVRAFLVRAQRQAAQGRSIICEGRDQGTVVFPGALCKFFLTAHPRERARRRLEDMARQGKELPALDDLERQIAERDERDATRQDSPMVPAADACLVDTTSMTLEQVMDHLAVTIRRAMEGTGR